MDLQVDGVSVTNVLYNGSQVDEVQIDGVKVWPSIVIDPVTLDGVPSTIEHNIFGGPAVAGYTIKSNGEHSQKEGTSSDLNPDWLNIGSGSDYEVRVTVQSGSNPSGTLGSWLLLSSNHTWDLTQSSGGVKQSTIKIELRAAGVAPVLDSTNCNLIAEVIM